MNSDSNHNISHKFSPLLTNQRASQIFQSTGLITGITLFVLVLIKYRTLESVIFISLILGGLGNLVLILAARRGYLTLTGIIQFSQALIFLAYILIQGNGTHDTAMLAFPVIMVVGVLLWGKQVIPTLSVITIGGIGLLINAEMRGLISSPFSASTGWSDLIALAILVLSAAAFLYLIVDRLDKNLQLARESELSWRSLVENAPTIIIKTNPKGIIQFINRPPWESKQDFLGQSIYDLLPEASAAMLKRCVQGVIQSRQPDSLEIKATPNNDQLVNYSAQIGLTNLNDLSEGLTCIITDITEQVRTRNFLEHMATHDLLTNLPNRLLFFDHLNQEIAKAQRHKTHLAIMLLDLDDFKLINDAYSHEDGDKLLRMLAKRLQRAIRPNDTVARLGGDEFALIISELHNPEDVHEVADKILGVISEPIIIDANEIFITGSVGIAIYPDDGELISILIQNADLAMYQAKNQGKNKIEFYYSELTDDVVKQINTAQLIRQALEQDKFLLEYQPQYNAIDHSIIGVEALVRMKMSGSDTILPNEFIFIAEKSGLIIQIGEWVLSTASGLIHYLEKENIPPLRIAVNLSEREWQDKFLADRVSKALNRSGLDPKLLELEITENSMFRSIENTQQIMNELKSLGVRLAIDDFGRGSSSLSYLGTLPVDTIKIDKDFTRQVIASDQTRAIVSGIIKISRELNLEIVVEGVETKDQLEFFKNQGCPIIQGWYFSPSVPQEDLLKLLRENDNGIKRQGTNPQPRLPGKA